jgi:sulfatase maturation enzyme AslB (radical SAM superfamily)
MAAPVVGVGTSGTIVGPETDPSRCLSEDANRLPMNANPRRQQSLKFDELYIEPVAVCNLDCKVCYTDRTPKTRLSMDDMLSFAIKQDAYERQYNSKGLRLVFFCGTGEVFVLKEFPDTLRAFHERFPATVLEVQTNGTFAFPNLDFPVEWSISIDGTRKYHELNRGQDTFRRTVNFLEAPLAKGDKIQVRTIVGGVEREEPASFQALAARELRVGAQLRASGFHPQRRIGSPLQARLHP